MFPLLQQPLCVRQSAQCKFEFRSKGALLKEEKWTLIYINLWLKTEDGGFVKQKSKGGTREACKGIFYLLIKTNRRQQFHSWQYRTVNQLTHDTTRHNHQENRRGKAVRLDNPLESPGAQQWRKRKWKQAVVQAGACDDCAASALKAEVAWMRGFPKSLQLPAESEFCNL